jgi:hypothetical protein
LQRKPMISKHNNAITIPKAMFDALVMFLKTWA